MLCVASTHGYIFKEHIISRTIIFTYSIDITNIQETLFSKHNGKKKIT